MREKFHRLAGFTRDSIPIRAIGRAVFGDRLGAAIFIGACLFYGLLWQVGFFLNDSWTIANTLVGVTEGHLYIDRVVYGSYLSTPGKSPGTHVVGRRVYGRNYGQVFLALPFFWLLRALSGIADLRILLAAGWSLGVVLFSQQIGVVIGQYREAVTGGSLLALVLFVANVWLARPLSLRWLHQLSLQLSTIVAAGFVAVMLYRLINLESDRRTATTIAVGAALGSPLAFWAALPKRHSLSALLVISMVFAFAHSRTTSDPRQGRRIRALSYACVGLLAWVHAAEALSVFIPLLAVDLATARSNRLRDLLYIGTVFAISILPFMLTNFAVTGNPMLPPRLWPSFQGSEDVLLNGGSPTQPMESGGPTTTASGEPEIASPSLGGAIGILSIAVSSLIESGVRLWSYVDSSLTNLRSDPLQVTRLFIRGGWDPYQTLDSQAINLTYLESAPLFGALVALPAFIRRIPRQWPRSWSTIRKVDLLAVAITIVFLLFNLQRLPVHASATVRYLHPLVPLSAYAVSRLPPVQNVCRERSQLLAWSSAAGLLIGTQILVIGLAALISTYGGAIQFHALINLGLAALTATWCLWSALQLDRSGGRITGAIVLGSTLAIGVVTMLFLVNNHLVYGDGILGVARLLRIVIPP